MTDNQRIAEWAGHKPLTKCSPGWTYSGRDCNEMCDSCKDIKRIYPDYPNDPAAAIGLLGVLRQKYKVEIHIGLSQVQVFVLDFGDDGQCFAVARAIGGDIPDAIAASVLAVAKGERP